MRPKSRQKEEEREAARKGGDVGSCAPVSTWSFAMALVDLSRNDL